MVLDIGKNIQMLRCKKGLSRESLCEDESKLSVRQLTRIENENANTTISVLNFIAKQLNVAVVNLIEQKSELPRDYLKLKHKVFKTYPVIGSLERLEYKEGILELIYEKYFFDLPLEEQLTIELESSIISTVVTKNVDYMENLLKNNFKRLIEPEVYGINELLLSKIYFEMLHSYGWNEGEFSKILKKLICSINYLYDLELVILDGVFTSVASICFRKKRYEDLYNIIKFSKQIRKQAHWLNNWAIWEMLEGKYEVVVNKNLGKADNKYLTAINIAELLSDYLLKEKILNEWWIVYTLNN